MLLAQPEDPTVLSVTADGTGADYERVARSETTTVATTAAAIATLRPCSPPSWAMPSREEVPARSALTSGALAKETTSQLSDLSSEAYAAGIAAIEAAAREAEARGETLLLRTRLELHATIGWL